MNQKSRILYLLIIISFIHFVGYAQEVYEIPSEQITVNGDDLSIEPGDTILIQGGNRPELHFVNVTGSVESPIYIGVKDEKVTINTDEHTGIAFKSCAYIHLSGKNNVTKYGIEIEKTGSIGVSVEDFSTDCEVDHIEIHNTGFAGIMAKTDPNCGRPDVSDFVMRNLAFHDNHIHHTHGEGFYVGYSWYPTREVDCDGTPTTLHPHAIKGLKIYNNYIHDTGWDGLQVGSATANVKVYSNVIIRYGLEGVQYQTNGVQISASSTGDLYNNFIYDGVGAGVSFFGGGNNRLYNNVIVNTGGRGVYQNDRDAKPGTDYQLYNNTIINPYDIALDLNANNTTGNLVANNLIVLEDGYVGIQGDDAKWTNEGNKLYAKIEEVGFVYPDTLNFRLAEGSNSIDAGHNVTSLKFDYDFMERPAGSAYDAGAFEYGSSPYEPPEVTAIKEEFISISVYPNPVVDSIVNFRLKQAETHPDRVEVFDISGNSLFDKKITFKNSKEYKLNIHPGLKNGVYSVVFYSKGRELISEKLIVNTK